MNAMAPTRPTELQVCRVRLTASPAAAAEARGQVRAAIRVWDIPVDEDIAVLLTSELVTNAISHETGTSITLAVACSFGLEPRSFYEAALEGALCDEATRGRLREIGEDCDWAAVSAAEVEVP